ncbi:hypothetical protein AAHC03_04793 [Spirometra sp. Aus1]
MSELCDGEAAIMSEVVARRHSTEAAPHTAFPIRQAGAWVADARDFSLCNKPPAVCLLPANRIANACRRAPHLMSPHPCAAPIGRDRAAAGREPLPRRRAAPGGWSARSPGLNLDGDQSTHELGADGKSIAQKRTSNHSWAPEIRPADRAGFAHPLHEAALPALFVVCVNRLI